MASITACIVVLTASLTSEPVEVTAVLVLLDDCNLRFVESSLAGTTNSEFNWTICKTVASFVSNPVLARSVITAKAFWQAAMADADTTSSGLYASNNDATSVSTSSEEGSEKFATITMASHSCSRVLSREATSSAFNSQLEPPQPSSQAHCGEQSVSRIVHTKSSTVLELSTYSHDPRPEHTSEVTEEQLWIGAKHVLSVQLLRRQSASTVQLAPISPRGVAMAERLRQGKLLSPLSPSKPVRQLEHVWGVSKQISRFRFAQNAVVAAEQLTALRTAAVFETVWVTATLSPSDRPWAILSEA
mmetsp:Transcript_15712/g.26238  ORF Transcript_15712/g.26238 Transcript_15712/m.26238 type:complete len:302 (+) Transcript_15712:5038-5943(+)